MASFTTMVRNITGSSTTETSNAQLYEFIKGGFRYTFGALPSELLISFAKDSTAVSGSSGYQITSDKILSIRRGNYTCQEVPLSLASSMTDTGSIMRASTKYPKYYIRSGKVYIKPDPTASYYGYISHVNINGMVNAISTTAVSPTSVTGVNVQILSNPIIHYAAGLDYIALFGYWNNKGIDYIATAGASITASLGRASGFLDSQVAVSTTDAIGSAKTKVASFIAASVTAIIGVAKSYVTNTTTGAAYYLGTSQEDSEMAGAYISAAAQEINTALANLQENGKYVSAAAQEISRAVATLQSGGNYNSAAAQEINRALAILQSNGSFRTREYRESGLTLIAQSTKMFEMASTEIRAYIESNTAYKAMLASIGGRR